MHVTVLGFGGAEIGLKKPSFETVERLLTWALVNHERRRDASRQALDPAPRRLFGTPR